MNMMSFGNMISRCGLDVRNVEKNIYANTQTQITPEKPLVSQQMNSTKDVLFKSTNWKWMNQNEKLVVDVPENS